mmetsp:Transcript_34609/g.79177  ORF Transcript_34609/g.79177 Transcript_34609/m.79177 type:complete len:398 (-) Transcript_34609:164-1357(-)
MNDVEADRGMSLVPYARLGGTDGEIRRALSNWRIAKIALGIVVFCFTVSAVPLYSKLVFQGTVTHPSFPYPLATAFLQLVFTSFALSVVSVLHRLICACNVPQCAVFPSQPTRLSWCLGPHVLYKIRHAAPVGLIFGLKFAITNWGLLMVPAPTHLLLQSTDLLWTLLFARVVNGERLDYIESAGAWMSSFGAIVISWDASMAAEIPFFPLLVNLLTPIALALTVTLLRKGVKELMDPNNRLGGMTAVEFTAWKIGFSAAVALLLSFVLEGGYMTLSRQGTLVADNKPPWWVALKHYPEMGYQLLLLDSISLLLFQVNLSWLTNLTSAVTVGIIAEIKVIPQWLINSTFGLPVTLTTANIIGSVIMLSASAIYAYSSLRKTGYVCKDAYKSSAPPPS